jgi:hypothetical protein
MQQTPSEKRLWEEVRKLQQRTSDLESVILANNHDEITTAIEKIRNRTLAEKQQRKEKCNTTLFSK